jgi:hypothetical protein
MIKFIPVLSTVNPKSKRSDYIPAILKQTKCCLISLIEAFNSKDFGSDTMSKLRYKLNYFNNTYIKPHNYDLVIDSGGYSFIKGDIHPQDLTILIDTYNEYLKLEKDNFNYIFSLDLPINLIFVSFNYKKTVEDYNRQSLENSIEVLKSIPELRNKFYFIWQFKLKEQYEIWKILYEELNLQDIIINRAIGGMVSLKGITQINYSPFIALAYRCFRDYLAAGNYDSDFKLHLLGVYGRSDRFEMLILEKLFTRYIEERGLQVKVNISYDTINYSEVARRKSKTLEIYDYDGEKIIEQYNKTIKVPNRIIQKIYYTKEMYRNIKKECGNLKPRLRLTNADSMSPLNIYSNLSIDRIFNDIIDQEGFIEAFYESKGYVESLKQNILKKLDRLNERYSYLFTTQFNSDIMNNIRETALFHKWCTEHFDNPEYLEDRIKDFIEGIDFPGGLK